MASAIPPEVLGFGLLIIGGMVLGGIALFLRQPLILAYILVGVLLGTEGFGVIGLEQQELLTHISGELGIAFLLFVVGLELSFKKILQVKSVVTFGTIATTAVLFIIGMFAGYFMGFDFMTGVYIGLILSFSSTLLVVKVLGEKNQVDTLPGRIMIGTLVFQDILIILAVSVLSIVAGAAPTAFLSWIIDLLFLVIGSIGSLAHVPLHELEPWVRNIAMLIGALLLFLLAYVLYRFVARYLFRYFSRSIEMLFVSALGFFFILSFAAAEMGFSISIGAFLSGIIIANTDHYLEVLNKIKTLSVFFSVLFFATLGFQLTFESFSALIVPVLVLCGLTLIVKPIITGVIVAIFGYDKRTAILTGLHMSQVSEFSLILVAVGIAQEQIAPEFLTITVIALLLTFTVSMYYTKYAHGITQWLQRRFRSLAPSEGETVPEIAIQHADAVLYGVEHLDEQFINEVRATRYTIVFVDPDPESLEYVRQKNLPAISGSLSNEEVLEKLPVHDLKLLISTVADYEESLFIIDHIRKHNKTAVLIVSTRSMTEALSLYEHGASYVHVANLVEDHAVQSYLLGADNSKLEQLRKAHIERLSRIVARGSKTVDIEDFVAVLAEQPFDIGKKAIQHTSRQFEEVDKFVKNIGKKPGKK